MYTSRLSQQGMSLVTVMLLSSLAGILVIASLRENITQERLSGNFQKKINAQLATERGVFETHAKLKAIIDDKANATVTLEQLIAEVGGDNANAQGNGSLDNMSYSVALSEDSSGYLVLESTGQRFEGASRLKARYELISEEGASPFANGIQGCEGVDLTGSGTIDSFHSGGEAIDSNTIVRTLEPGSEVILGGASPVFGDIFVTGDISVSSGSSAIVHGSLHANGDITLNQNIIMGNVLARGSYSHNGGSVGGYVRTLLNATMGYGAVIENPENNVEDILYGGVGNFSDPSNQKDHLGISYNDAKFNRVPVPAPEIVPESHTETDANAPRDPATHCDPLDIAKNIIIPESDKPTSLDNFYGSGWNKTYQFTPTSGSGDLKTMQPVSSTVFGVAQKVYRVNNFKMESNFAVTIKGGDVFLYVAGDFSMMGYSGGITIEEDSSLTLLVEGKVNVGAGGRIVSMKPGLTSVSKRPSFSIYSSNTDSQGVRIYGNSKIYAAIYAPFTEVSVQNSGELLGSIRAKKLSVTGGAAIHFDHALADTTPSGGSGGKTTLKLVGWEY